MYVLTTYLKLKMSDDLEGSLYVIRMLLEIEPFTRSLTPQPK